MEINLNTLNTVVLETNIIPDSALHDVYIYLNEVDRAIAGVVEGGIGDWANTSNPWSQWKTDKYTYLGITYSGMWTTRFKKLLKMRYKIIPSDAIMSKIGGILGGYQEEKKYHFAITKYFDWREGDFKERDGQSCWWHGNISSRVGLAARDYAYSVLFYAGEKSHNDNPGKGIGRCWLIEQGGAMFIFNAYGIPLSDIANVLETHFNMSSKRITIISEEAYINAGNHNNEGRSGGSQGRGHVIGTREIITKISSTVHLPNFAIDVARCIECGKTKVPGELRLSDNEVLCGRCLETTRTTCGNCGRKHKKKDTHQLYYDYDNRNVDMCNTCFDEIGTKAEHRCENHGQCVRATTKIWHTSKRYCSHCFERGEFIVCSICRRAVDDYVTIQYKSPAGTRKLVTMCMSCRKNNMQEIRRKGDKTWQVQR